MTSKLKRGVEYIKKINIPSEYDLYLECEKCNENYFLYFDKKAFLSRKIKDSLIIRCQSGHEPNFGQEGKKLTKEIKKNLQSISAVLKKQFKLLAKEVPKDPGELKKAIRDPQHPFTIAVLTAIALLSMEASGFGIFWIVAWFLGNVILTTVGIVAIPIVVAIWFQYRKTLEQRTFLSIVKELRQMWGQYNNGELSDTDFLEESQKIVSKAFRKQSIEGVLTEAGFRPEMIKRISQSKKNEIITGPDHLEKFKQAINESKQELIIYSGWIGVTVMNEIKTDLIDALKRKVTVNMLYGYDEEKKQKEEFARKEEAALRCLSSIKRISQSNSLSVIRFGEIGSHQKVLCCDDQYAMCGSANWLFNAQYTRKETTLKVFDREIVRDLRRIAMQDIEENIKKL
jgi:sugar-specific transcriptional regulator TrmB